MTPPRYVMASLSYRVANPRHCFVSLKLRSTTFRPLAIVAVVPDGSAATGTSTSAVPLLVGELGEDRDDPPGAQVMPNRARQVRPVATHPVGAGARPPRAPARDSSMVHQDGELRRLTRLSRADGSSCATRPAIDLWRDQSAPRADSYSSTDPPCPLGHPAIVSECAAPPSGRRKEQRADPLPLGIRQHRIPSHSRIVPRGTSEKGDTH